ncbi:MAG: hypothetical protein RLZZ298_2701 [Pseudomonadota bacterium]|jgi:hypothetical protein
MLRRWLAMLVLIGAGNALASESVNICYAYGCLAEAEVVYSASELREIDQMLALAVDAENERKILAQTIGLLYAIGGEQSDIRNDKGGNYADDNLPGRMDCIDHSTSTTRLLKLLEARGNLRWHRVLDADVRHFARIFPAHYSAVIEEIMDGEAARFVVDSWFVDNGQPAVILPLDEWKKGAGPDV